MKAIFIDGKNANPICISPEEGEIVTIMGQCSVFPNNYDIVEYPIDKNGTPQSFAKHRFIPLSEIDETTFERNYQKETA